MKPKLLEQLNKKVLYFRHSTKGVIPILQDLLLIAWTGLR